jgi:hypothetical protein
MDSQELEIHEVSSAARTSIRVRVFSVFADLNISDCRVKAFGNPPGALVNVYVTRATNGRTEKISIVDSVQAGSKVESLIRQIYPPAIREVFDGGPF